ncbi:hypothetical protein VTK26DRAFT_345 [Humicola hyalothermophila]
MDEQRLRSKLSCERPRGLVDSTFGTRLRKKKTFGESETLYISIMNKQPSVVIARSMLRRLRIACGHRNYKLCSYLTEFVWSACMAPRHRNCWIEGLGRFRRTETAVVLFYLQGALALQGYAPSLPCSHIGEHNRVRGSAAHSSFPVHPTRQFDYDQPLATHVKFLLGNGTTDGSYPSSFSNSSL